MIDLLKKYFGSDSDGASQQSTNEHDIRVATCALFVEMANIDGRSVAAIPGDVIVDEWDLMYYIEAVDVAGAGVLAPLPDPVRTIPYWVVKVLR